MFWRKKIVKLQTGKIEFELGDGETWETDLIVIKLLAEDLQRIHQLQTRPDNGTVIATGAFLEELAAAYRSQGCEGCTAAMARQIWITAGYHFKKFNAKFSKELRKVR